MKYILVLLICMIPINAAKVVVSKWTTQQTFRDYVASRSLPDGFLKSIQKEDRKFLTEIRKNHTFYELIDDKGVLLQALIPISEVMQIHIAKKKNQDEYLFDIIPIEYTLGEYYAKVVIENNPYTDTLKQIKNKNVAKRLSSAIANVIDGTKLKKGDEINFIYTQRKRAGRAVFMPDIKIVRIKSGGKERFVYVDEDGNGFLQTGKRVAYQVKEKEKKTYTKKVTSKTRGSKFIMPLRNVRITSHFSYSRYHPILKRNRPHHGTDFGARKGTPLLAVNDGIITYASRMGSYGNVVKIKHEEGYESLYAHQSRIAVKRGDRVKKGEVIGYVGSTGRSTGPHLHFGLQKNGKWVNPMHVLGKKSIRSTMLKKFTVYEDVMKTKYKTVTIKNIKVYKNRLLKAIKTDKPSYVWKEL